MATTIGSALFECWKSHTKKRDREAQWYGNNIEKILNSFVREC